MRELFELNLLPGALGAEIRGVDLGGDIGDDMIDRPRFHWEGVAAHAAHHDRRRRDVLTIGAHHVR